jgi:uncharacterized protein YpiB (UPF0302 family)
MKSIANMKSDAPSQTGPLSLTPEMRVSSDEKTSPLILDADMRISQEDSEAVSGKQVEQTESTELRTSYQTFSQAKEAFFAPELLEKKKNLTAIEQQLRKGKLSDQEKEAAEAQFSLLQQEINSVEQAYEDAKAPYAEALRTYLHSKGKSTDEQINLMIAGRFFARTKEQRYLAQENRKAELNQGEYQSYKDAEIQRKEALLDLEQKSIFKRLVKSVEKIPPKYKMGVGGAVVAGSVASGGLVPVLLGMGAAIGTRLGIDKIGMNFLDRKNNVNRIEQIKAFQVARGLAAAEQSFEQLYQADKRNRKIVTGLGYAAGIGAALAAGTAARGAEIPGAPETVGDAWSKFASFVERVFERDQSTDINQSAWDLGVTHGNGPSVNQMSAKLGEQLVSDIEASPTAPVVLSGDVSPSAVPTLETPVMSDTKPALSELTPPSAEVVSSELSSPSVSETVFQSEILPETYTIPNNPDHSIWRLMQGRLDGIPPLPAMEQIDSTYHNTVITTVEAELRSNRVLAEQIFGSKTAQHPDLWLFGGEQITTEQLGQFNELVSRVATEKGFLGTNLSTN